MLETATRPSETKPVLYPARKYDSPGRGQHDGTRPSEPDDASPAVLVNGERDPRYRTSKELAVLDDDIEGHSGFVNVEVVAVHAGNGPAPARHRRHGLIYAHEPVAGESHPYAHRRIAEIDAEVMDVERAGRSGNRKMTVLDTGRDGNREPRGPHNRGPETQGTRQA